MNPSTMTDEHEKTRRAPTPEHWALGPIAGAVEHQQHDEPVPKVEDKRYADLVIHAIWLVKAMGYDPAALVANRVWDLGIGPKRDELPPHEREG